MKGYTMKTMKTVKTQKTHFDCQDGNRYFWNVTTLGGRTIEYRSRHSTSLGVRQEFKKMNRSLTSVKPKMR